MIYLLLFLGGEHADLWKHQRRFQKGGVAFRIVPQFHFGDFKRANEDLVESKGLVVVRPGWKRFLS